MDFVLDVLADAGKDTLVLIPFLFLTYVAISLLEIFAGDRAVTRIQQAGHAGPALGAVLGLIPQCGFSAVGSMLFADRIVTLGTLVAVILSTSDEMLPLLLAERVDAAVLLKILATKAILGVIAGYAVDGAIHLLAAKSRRFAALLPGSMPEGAVQEAEDMEVTGADGVANAAAEDSQQGSADGVAVAADVQPGAADGVAVASTSSELGASAEGASDEDAASDAAATSNDYDPSQYACDCGCGEPLTKGQLVRWIALNSAYKTLQVTVFIFAVTLVLTAVIEGVGEDVLASFLSANEALATFAAGLVGMVPNCAASVVVTQLYLDGALGFGPMMAGTLVAAGAGYLVLFRTNANARENVSIAALLYVLGVGSGLVMNLLGM